MELSILIAGFGGGAIRGLVNSVGDPYSSFFDPEEAKLFLSDTEGSFEGIGAEIGVRKGLITVISPIHGTPAERSGLKAGDKVTGKIEWDRK